MVFVAAFGLSVSANAAETETIKIGSTVHFLNQFSYDAVNVGDSSIIGKPTSTHEGE